MPDDHHAAPGGPLGVHLTPTGARAAVAASAADAVWLCLLDEVSGSPDHDGVGSAPDGWSERRVPLERNAGGVWTGHVEGVRAGQRFGLRVSGPWDPGAGHRHDPSKLLLDPYAPVVDGTPTWGPQLFSHDVTGPAWTPVPGPPPGLDSSGCVPHGVLAELPLADPATRPRTPWSRTVIYEAHLRGLTKAHPGVPEPLRGTWAGLAHPEVVRYLVDLGVTAVELLPVQAAMTEVPLARRGQQNAWGYSTLSWFAPEPRFVTAAARAAGPAAVLAEIADAVAALHAAGLEVLCDVVLNHSCEGAAGDGPTLSLRGLDAAGYYRLDGGGHDVDSTGCGNSLDFGQPRVVALALDSLRHWVTTFGVDGFRFDLAPTLARGRDGRFSPDHPFLVAAAADPVLSDVKLISEPWDLGPDGWQTGAFPEPFADWNDAFRSDARDFWLAGPRRLTRGEGAGPGLRRLARRLTGSADVFGTGSTGTQRGPLGSISFVTAHDGFTLADLTAFEHKRNEANGESGRDGTDDNRSWNHGAEGWLTGPPPRGTGVSEVAGVTTSPDPGPAEAPDQLLVEALRRRSMRNLLATLLLSAGVPMLTAGDESGRTQQGNNNAYCLDDATTWVSWTLQGWQDDLLATSRLLLALRRDHEVLRPGVAPVAPGDAVSPPRAGTVSAAWFNESGSIMTGQQWDDDAVRTVQVLLQGSTGTPVASAAAHVSGTPAASGTPDVSGAAPAVPLLLVIHGDLDDGSVVLPPLGEAAGGLDPASAPGYRLLWNSADEHPLPATTGTFHAPGTSVPVSALSVRLYRVGD